MGLATCVLFALGAATIAVGIALVSIPASVIVTGVLLVAGGVLNLDTSRGTK